MPYTEGLPFAPSSHESHQAAVHQLASREAKTRAYLRFLYRHGPATDHEARAALGLPLSSITSIRNGAMKCGLVDKGETTRPSPLGGHACRVWVLNSAGRAAVAAMTEAA
jgi:hypothetical protein